MITKKKHAIPIYFGDLLIFLVDDIDEANKFFGTAHNSKESGAIDAMALRKHYSNGYSAYALVFFRNTKPKLKVIVHEVTHIKNMLFEDRGIGLDVANDEAEAYFVTWVLDVVYEYLKKIDHIKL